MTYKLYKWQQECLENWANNNHQGIVNVVTGAGKTFLALSAIRKVLNANLRVKIVVPTINLLFQWKKEIIKMFGKEYGDSIALIYGESKGFENAVFSIYVVNSARYTISKAIINDMNKGMNVFMIVDEAHRYLSKENSKIYHYIYSNDFKKEQLYSLGLTATIEMKQVDNLIKSSIGKVIYTYNHKEALRDEIISPFSIFEIGLDFETKERQEYLKISHEIEILYNKIIKRYPYLNKIDDTKEFIKLLNSLASEDEQIDIYLKLLLKRKRISLTSITRLKCGVQIIKNLYDKKIIVFAQRISQIKQFEKMIRENGIKNVACYHSKQAVEYRKQILEDYKVGNINILLTCKALDEGIDVPDAQVAIVLSSSSVPRQRIQRLGRVLRKNNNKYMASLFYLYIRDANDDALFLEELYLNNNKIMRLRYFNIDKSFSNYTYEDQIIKNYKNIYKTKDSKLFEEYNRCLQEGTLKTDWLLSKEQLNKKIHESKTIKEKNYYVVMKKISSN